MLIEILIGVGSVAAGAGSAYAYRLWKPLPIPIYVYTPPVASKPVCTTRTYVYADGSRLVQHSRCGAGHGDAPDGWVVCKGGGHEMETAA